MGVRARPLAEGVKQAKRAGVFPRTHVIVLVSRTSTYCTKPARSCNTCTLSIASFMLSWQNGEPCYSYECRAATSLYKNLVNNALDMRSAARHTKLLGSVSSAAARDASYT